MSVRLRKDMLVRRRMPCGLLPIGPWLIVRAAKNGAVQAEVVDSDYMLRKTGQMRILARNNIYVPTRMALHISPEIIDDIIVGKQWVVSAPVSKTWLQAYKEKPEIITFYATNGNKVVIKVNSIAHQVKSREEWIKVYIDSIITKVIWS